MATIDLTLNRLMLPGLANYTPPFGTKKAADVALKTEEGCNNFTLPFELQRPVIVSETSACSGNVEHNAVVNITNSSAVFTLTNGAFVGCTLDIICSAASGVATVAHSTVNYAVPAGQKIRLIWNGVSWQFENSEAGLSFETARWLIFDFSAENRKTLKIKKGTRIPLDITSQAGIERRWLTANVDTSFDLSSAITAAGNAADR